MDKTASRASLDPYQRANSLAELVAWADVDFVRCAYVTVLGRQPDAEGEAHYVHLLRRGTSKLDLLRRLRRSSEGRQHDPGIAGLDKKLREHHLANLPLVGPLLRAFTRAEGNSVAERQHRALANQMAVARTEQERGFSKVEQSVYARLPGTRAPAPAIPHTFAGGDGTGMPGAIAEALVELRSEQRTQYQALQLSHDVTRSAARANGEIEALREDIGALRNEVASLRAQAPSSEDLASLATAFTGQYRALQLGLDLIRSEGTQARDIAALHEGLSDGLGALQRELAAVRGEAFRRNDVAALDARADTRLLALMKAADQLSAQNRALELSFQSELKGLASGPSIQSSLDRFEAHFTNLFNAQIEVQSALRGRLDDALALLRGAVTVEDVAAVRDRLDTLAVLQRDQVDLAAAETGGVRDMVAGLSARLPEIRDAIAMVGPAQHELLDRVTRIDRQVSQQALAFNDQILVKTDIGYVVLPDDDPVLVVAVRHMDGLLEPGTVAVIRHLLDDGDSMVDAGAHVGLITLIAARETGESGRVFAIEPVPRTADALETMLSLNSLGARVRLNRCAAGRENGTAQINVGRILGHSSLLPLDGSTERSPVEVRTIDDIVPAGTAVKLVKLDVEGFELECLEGMRRVLADNPTIGIVAEFGPSHLKRAGTSIADWFGAFQAQGFDGWEIDETTGRLSVPRSPRALAAAHSLNFLFWRGDKRNLAGLEA